MPLHNVTAILDVPATAETAETVVDALAGHSPAAGGDAAGRLSVTVSLDAASSTDAVARSSDLISGAVPFRLLSSESMTSAKFDWRCDQNRSMSH